MSKEEVQKVIDKAATNATFRQLLFRNADEALKDHKSKLTDEEVAGLKALTPEVFEGIEASIDAAAKPSPWWHPSSFKETGGTVLSLVLLVMMAGVLGYALQEIDSDPRSVMVGDAVQTVNSWDRAKDLISIFFPLFGAVVSFWLGVAVEGRRADENKQTANEAKQTAETTQSKLQAVLGEASPTVLDEVRRKYPGLL